MNFKKRITVISLVLTFLLVFSQNVLALEAGYEGVSTYSSSSGSCIYGNRAGAEYVTNLAGRISVDLFPPAITTKFKYTNGSAWDQDLTSTKYQNTVDFFAYSGHGLSFVDENSLHFFASNSSSYHNSSSENNDAFNARTKEVRMGDGTTLKWVTIYSCHWLEDNGSSTKLNEIYKTFTGANLQMGYASTMYLDSREGTAYGDNIKNSNSFRYSFVTPTKKYQVQRQSGDTTYRVMGYTLAKDDTKKSFLSPRASSFWYINKPTAYSIIEQGTIPHTGNPI